ncbi:MAG: putative sulfate exporter family transporter [Burkholderiaceae bacterium]
MISSTGLWVSERWRGLLAAVTIGAASLFVAEHYGGPSVLYALLLGMAFNFLSEDPKVVPGMTFASTTLLRIGVGLLGARIAAEQLALLTPGLLVLIVGATFATVAVSLFLNRWVKWPRAEAALVGGAVAICGASASIALATVIPKKDLREQSLLAVVVAVTAMSTLAMIIYPFIASALGLPKAEAGIFLGATIHDVAQVVGAGAMIGGDATETATMAKMLRVAMLVPMLILFGMMFRDRSPSAGQSVHWTKNIPLFLIGFIVLAVVNVAGWIPKNISTLLGETSRLLILIAIAGLGIKTSLGKLREVGWAPLILMAADSVFLVVVVLTGLVFLR